MENACTLESQVCKHHQNEFLASVKQVLVLQTLAASAQNILFLETLKLSKSTVVKEQIIVEENGECFGLF
jgi:hypothetical protein